ncbi:MULTISPECIES: LysR family transcriptional regulator [unclassified Chelatococcus]|uniref:LysR family transcriptional regulator n=1 Tax=unclassified Chelatococcus TaxID=2638111 RepID=UPI001BD16681|nr:MULTISPECIES: LysR family transcriptional regulator [unclassified Chelatococcus]CAH1652374.1 DNA-binding transcriptional LysR family regulator [Hyphomicrobiales bacterium]MBS7739975.1 LysR family transcriptional regulator [Chelatococcus sp. HY11]MBX3547016.1 LysR family transcriptional regulator [Chelatococcus sp.]MCO5078725.1 LysR family transcriptional regulator [Chelatococcus sp.]CAH1686010.1 DNA-binding transcriptional LysR family regulator [Hyphomicrobiales bacterium]
MNTSGMELRQLGYFAVACQNPNLVAAAAELGIAQSTLSAGLQALGEQFGVALFQHAGKRVYPQPAALWLFRNAVTLLHAESFARAYIQSGAEGGIRRVAIDLNLSFAIGRLSKALGRCVELLHPLNPDVFFDYRFLFGPEGPASEPSGVGPLIAADPCGVIEIDMIDPSHSGSRDMIPLIDDPWVAVSLAKPLGEVESTPLVLLRMSRDLQNSLMQAAEAGGFAHRIQIVDEDPTRLPRLMIEQPQAAFVMPRSMLSNRLGLIDVHVEPLRLGASRWIGARIRVDHPAARVFVDALRNILQSREQNVVFQPKITLRQMRYFQLLHRSGGIAAAARAANVTQPAVTAQLRKLEQTLDTPLYRIAGGSLAINTAGERLRTVVDAIEVGLKKIATGRDAVVAGHSQLVRIGMIPVADSGSTVARAMAAAITSLRRAWPGYTFRIVEARTKTLHDLVSSGAVAFAVVETANAQATRVPLGLYEPLALIANKALGLEDGVAIPFSRLKDLPLVLGGASFGIRALLDQAARATGIRLRACIEVESFPLSLAMVEQDELCTVLPPQAVLDSALRERVTVSTLVDPVIRQPLNVIFSGQRALSDVERDFIALLKQQLSAVLQKNTEYGNEVARP